MSVELPFAPVDSVIRRNAGGLRVSAEAAEELARRIQEYGSRLAADAAETATAATSLPVRAATRVRRYPRKTTSSATALATTSTNARLFGSSRSARVAGSGLT